MKKMLAFIGALTLLFIAGSAFGQQKLSGDNYTNLSDYDAEKQHQVENYKYDLNDPAEIEKALFWERKVAAGMKAAGYRNVPGFTPTGNPHVDEPAYEAARAAFKESNFRAYCEMFDIDMNNPYGSN